MTSATRTVVPLLDLEAQYRPIRDELLAAITRVCDSQRFIMGPEVDGLERELASYLGVRDAVTVSSGTDAILAALMALGIGPGDEVITSTYSFFATAGCVVRVGATPVLVDIDPVTYNIDPAGVAAAVSPRTKAIIPVHLYGLCADMDPILAIARDAGIPVIEDAAQAIGATYKERQAGSMGAAGCFSFFPSKNLGAFGDAGMVTTNDEALARAVRQRRSYGEAKKYYHVEKGVNTRLDTMQAALLNVKLPRLNWSNENRRRAARLYDERLARIPAITPPPAPADALSHVYHLYVIRTPKRDDLQAFLDTKGIQSGIHYPIPIHRQEAYRELASSAPRLPNTDAFAPQILSLPMFPELTEAQVDRVCDAVAEFHAR
jgi:dTDP-4-amino-4,6-dideoxygalactose transaminase